MQHVKTVIVKGKALEYFITQPDSEFNEFGIMAKYEDKVEIVEALSDDYEFVHNLAVSLAESNTMPEFIQELCEEALFEASFIEFIEEEKWI